MANHLLLEAKAKKLQAELTQWALEQELLAPGEQIIFSLRVVPVELVSRDPLDLQSVTERIEITGDYTRKGMKYVAPAELNDVEAGLVLSFLQNKAKRNMVRLLGNRNNPIEIDPHKDGHFYETANDLLRSQSINGKWYRIVRQNLPRRSTGESRRYRVQLWEYTDEITKK